MALWLANQTCKSVEGLSEMNLNTSHDSHCIPERKKCYSVCSVPVYPGTDLSVMKQTGFLFG